MVEVGVQVFLLAGKLPLQGYALFGCVEAGRQAGKQAYPFKGHLEGG
jgi:hypothetical protein